MLDQLPVELLVRTFEYLAVSEHEPNHFNDTTRQKVRTLASVCITCKRFQVLATPFLYRTFVKPVTTGFFSREPQTHLHLFLRTLIAREDLRRLVKHIYIGCFEIKISERRYSKSYPLADNALRKQYYQTAKHYDLGDRDPDWLKDLHSKQSDDKPCSEDAEIALLLCLVEDVSRLSLDFFASGVQIDDETACFTMAFLKQNVTSMVNLRELDITTCYDETITNAFLHVSDLLRIPQLMSLKGSGDIADWKDHDANLGGDDDLIASQIRCLELDECKTELADLNRFLKRCPRLERLVFENAEQRHRRAEDRHKVFRWSSIAEGLSYSENHLQFLKLRLDEPMLLSQFKALTHLCTDEVSLFGSLGQDLLDWPDNGSSAIIGTLIERLPPHLENIDLEDCTVITLRCLEICINSVKPILPRLRRVLVQRTGFVEVWDNYAESLQEAMNRAGVDFDNRPQRLRSINAFRV